MTGSRNTRRRKTCSKCEITKKIRSRTRRIKRTRKRKTMSRRKEAGNDDRPSFPSPNKLFPFSTFPQLHFSLSTSLFFQTWQELRIEAIRFVILTRTKVWPGKLYKRIQIKGMTWTVKTQIIEQCDRWTQNLVPSGSRPKINDTPKLTLKGFSGLKTNNFAIFFKTYETRQGSPQW